MNTPYGKIGRPGPFAHRPIGNYGTTLDQAVRLQQQNKGVAAAKRPQSNVQPIEAVWENGRVVGFKAQTAWYQNPGVWALGAAVVASVGLFAYKMK